MVEQINQTVSCAVISFRRVKHNHNHACKIQPKMHESGMIDSVNAGKGGDQLLQSAFYRTVIVARERADLNILKFEFEKKKPTTGTTARLFYETSLS